MRRRSVVADPDRGDVADLVCLDLGNCRYAIRPALSSLTSADVQAFLSGVADGSVESVTVKPSHGGG